MTLVAPELLGWGPVRLTMTSERGFSLIDVIVTLAVLSILAGVGIGVSSTIVRMVRGESGAQQLDAFLKRHREMAVARRRDIEIRFLPPNRIQSALRAVPDPPNPTPAPAVLETVTFEGGIEYRAFPLIPDTPNQFGNAAAISVGGNLPVMFSSDGAFLDIDSNPVNATLLTGVDGDPLTAGAVTILGATATIERWRWNGAEWTR
jgi:prepilin-type N-terminal cleavage/methylation domain-containing protein